MGIFVKRPVRVKVVMTESFRRSRTAEISTALARLDVVGRQLAVRLESDPDDALRGRLDDQVRRNEQAKAALKRELDGICALHDGAQYVQGVLEGTVEIDVGDDFAKLGACEIIVKDGVIVEIRDGLCPDESD